MWLANDSVAPSSAAPVRMQGVEKPPVTCFAMNGDVSIAFQVFGEGATTLLWVPGFITHQDLMWTIPQYASFMRRLAAMARVVTFDRPGTGMSDPVPRLSTFEDRVDDAIAVLDYSGVEQATVMGFSEGGPLGLLLAAAHPERVERLVLYGTFVAATHFPEATWMRLYDIADHWGEGRMTTLFAPSLSDNAVFRRIIGTFERAAATPDMARAILRSFEEVDVRSVLPVLQHPTLVLHRRGDFIPIEGARMIASAIPGGKFEELEGIDHIPFVGNTDSVLQALADFLDQPMPPSGEEDGLSSSRVLGTVMFTDIVGSTNRASEMGDVAWKDLLAEHHRIVRERLAEHRGREIKTTGDGFLAFFDGPVRATHCALALLDDATELGVQLRIGLHAGECEVFEDFDLAGIAVHVASRIQAIAQPNEVLTSLAVKDLAISSDLRFEERGTYQLKGVPGTWPLFVARVGRASPGLAAVTFPLRLRRSDRVLVRMTRLPGAGSAFRLLSKRLVARA